MSRRRRRTKHRTARTTRVIAKKALAKATKIEQSVEWKHRDIALSGLVTTTPTITQITNIDQGDGKLNRDGAEIVTRSVWIRGFMVAGQAGVATVRNRVMVFIDKTPDAPNSSPTIAMLLDSGVGGSLDQFRELDNKHRFVILHDEWFQLTNNTTSAAHHINIFKKLNLKTLFTSTSGSANRSHNQVYLLLLSSGAVDERPQADMSVRIRFTDG